MIIFDQLRISDDGKKVFLNAHVNAATAFTSIYIKEITIQTADQVSEDTCLPTDEYIYKKTLTTSVKNVDLVIAPTDPETDSTWASKHTTFSDQLLFVFLTCEHVGQVDPCFIALPCRLDELTSVGVTFDENLLYQRVMDYTRELAADCTIPQGFIDLILLWNAFKAAIETEHFIPAIKYYNILFGNDVVNGYSNSNTISSNSSGNHSVIRGCGCH